MALAAAASAGLFLRLATKKVQDCDTFFVGLHSSFLSLLLPPSFSISEKGRRRKGGVYCMYTHTHTPIRGKGKVEEEKEGGFFFRYDSVGGCPQLGS